ncbi:hypothetical protein I317_01369 [Kwoniella heveanensis CBS 569]|nr:hypothetical protein I317_01369 [Kwoniella heveanensis CBS 569]
MSYLFALVITLTLFREAYAALSLGCYRQEARHGQISIHPDQPDPDCIKFCQGYFPNRSYAYWWQEYEMAEGYVNHCWCTNHMPEGQFATPQDGNCATNAPVDIVTPISVYLIRPIDGWTDFTRQYLDLDVLEPVTYFRTVPDCLAYCHSHRYATWWYDLFYEPEHSDEFSIARNDQALHFFERSGRTLET